MYKVHARIVTKRMDHSPCGEANCSSGNQKMSYILFDFYLTTLSNVKLHYVDGKYMKHQYGAPVR